MFVFMFRRFSFVLFVVSVFIMFSCENDPEIIYRDVIVEVPVEIPVEVPVEVPFEVPIEVLVEVPVVTYYEFDPKHPEDLPIGKTGFLTTYYSDDNLSTDLFNYYIRNYNELTTQGYRSSYWDAGYENEYINSSHTYLWVTPISTWDKVNILLHKHFAYSYITRESEDVFIITKQTFVYNNDLPNFQGIYENYWVILFIENIKYYRN